MSIKYEISQRYTNHCLRVTSLQVLDNTNVDMRPTIRVSGHKQTDSLQNYSRRLSASRKRSISNVLSSSLIAEEPNASSSNTVTDHHAKRFASLVPSLSAMDLVEVDDDVDRFIESIPEEMLYNPSKQSSMNFQPPLYMFQVILL